MASSEALVEAVGGAVGSVISMAVTYPLVIVSRSCPLDVGRRCSAASTAGRGSAWLVVPCTWACRQLLTNAPGRCYRWRAGCLLSYQSEGLVLPAAGLPLALPRAQVSTWQALENKDESASSRERVQRYKMLPSPIKELCMVGGVKVDGGGGSGSGAMGDVAWRDLKAAASLFVIKTMLLPARSTSGSHPHLSSLACHAPSLPASWRLLLQPL